jgi:hypothetical protein
MSAQMTLVYLKQTGHVLAALRQLDDAPPQLEALIGDTFPFRATQKPSAPVATFELPRELLEISSVVFDERVIGRPQRFVVDGDRVAELGDPTAPGVTLSKTALTLTLAGGPSADVKVFAAVRERDSTQREQRLLAGTWPAASDPFPINLTVSPGGVPAGIGSGDADVVVAVAGCPLFHEICNAP